MPSLELLRFRPRRSSWRYTAAMSRYGHPLQSLSAMWAGGFLAPSSLTRLSTFSRVSVVAVILKVLASCAAAPPEPDRGHPACR